MCDGECDGQSESSFYSPRNRSVNGQNGAGEWSFANAPEPVVDYADQRIRGLLLEGEEL